MTALGVALTIAALVLIAGEAHLSTGGLIGAAASVAAVAGISFLLIGAGAATFVVLAVAAALIVAASTAIVLARRSVLRSRRSRPRTGREALVGHVGVVRSARDAQLEVFLDGALWRAEPEPMQEPTELHDGDRVVVDRVNGLTLRVHRAEEWELNP